MRALVLGVVTAATALACAPRPSEAAYNRPWCAQYYDRSAVFSCAFYSYGECMATISGIGGVCMQNPWLPPPPSYAARPPKPRRHAAQH